MGKKITPDPATQMRKVNTKYRDVISNASNVNVKGTTDWPFLEKNFTSLLTDQ